MVEVGLLPSLEETPRQPGQGGGVAGQAQERRQGHDPGVDAGVAPDEAGRSLEAVSQDGRHVLEGQTGQQAAEQPIALLGEGQLLIGVDRGPSREQPTRLQLDESRRDQEELGGHLEVQRLDPGEVLQVLVHQPRQAHLGDLELALGDQPQEKVERSLEDRGGHLVAHGAGAMVLPPAGAEPSFSRGRRGTAHPSRQPAGPPDAGRGGAGRSPRPTAPPRPRRGRRRRPRRGRGRRRGALGRAAAGRPGWWPATARGPPGRRGAFRRRGAGPPGPGRHALGGRLRTARAQAKAWRWSAAACPQNRAHSAGCSRLATQACSPGCSGSAPRTPKKRRTRWPGPPLTRSPAGPSPRRSRRRRGHRGTPRSSGRGRGTRRGRGGRRRGGPGAGAPAAPGGCRPAAGSAAC